VGDLPIGWATAPRILVEESQVTSARKIIEEAEIPAAASVEDEHDEVTRCLACGKIMAEGDVKCRSCGWSYQAEENSPDQENVKEATTTNGLAAAVPKPPNGSQAISVSPKLSRHALWGEVLAVLAIGVFPYLISVFASAWHAPVVWPFWAESLVRCLESSCITFAVLYLIYRSGEWLLPLGSIVRDEYEERKGNVLTGSRRASRSR
jgi:hypothetical protein